MFPAVKFFSQEVRERLSMFTIRSAGISAVPTASPTLQPTLPFRDKLTGLKFAFTAPA